MPLAGMDALTKSWYMMIHDWIGNELMSANETPVVQPEVEEPLVVSSKVVPSSI
jgi:hypothetical protein